MEGELAHATSWEGVLTTVEETLRGSFSKEHHTGDWVVSVDLLQVPTYPSISTAHPQHLDAQHRRHTTLLDGLQRLRVEADVALVCVVLGPGERRGDYPGLLPSLPALQCYCY